MRLLRAVDLLCGLVLTTLSINPHAATVNLPSFPLAVKSPYLSTWLPGNYISHVQTGQPQFWNGQSLTWPVLARVDGTTYSLFCDASGLSNATAAALNSYSYTSSHTYFHLTAGSANFTLDFFTPILPGPLDYLRQSLPYSYLMVSATGDSSKQPKVQVLSAIDQTWTSQNGAANLNYTVSGSAGLFWFYNSNEIPFTEDDDMATYGSVIFATETGSSVTRDCGTSAGIFSEFTSSGKLEASTQQKKCGAFDLVALSKDLGKCGRDASIVTFAVGLDRVQAINYLGQTQTGYYRTKYPTVPEAVEYVLGENYQSSLTTSLAFDAAVRSKSESVSTNFGSKYADIVEASVRQTFAAMELTVPIDNMGASPWAFLKEISSDGNVNTVDIIYQTWPIFISLNPEYIKLLFDPIVSYLDSGQWPEPYVIHDIGTSYPNATGHKNGVAESMPLFETSSLFILLYAYQKLTGDTSYASQYQPLLDDYAQYLANNSLYPSSQLISVDAIQPQANQTALAIQSTIGLNAASILTGKDAYATLAHSFAHTIYDEGLGLNGPTPEGSTHFTYYYGQNSTWNVVFTSYSDVVLNLSTFPAEAWEMESRWYNSQIEEEGLPFAGPETYTSYTPPNPITWGLTDWNVVAASVSSAEVQQKVIDTTWTFLTNGLNTIPFGTRYYVEGPNVGVWIANKARPTVGSHFALLALEQGTWGTQY